MTVFCKQKWETFVGVFIQSSLDIEACWVLVASYCYHHTAVFPHRANTDATFYCRALNTPSTLPAMNITVCVVKRNVSFPIALSHTGRIFTSEKMVTQKQTE